MSGKSTEFWDGMAESAETSDTPRTDVAASNLFAPEQIADMVSTDLARQLERELAHRDEAARRVRRNARAS